MEGEEREGQNSSKKIILDEKWTVSKNRELCLVKFILGSLLKIAVLAWEVNSIPYTYLTVEFESYQLHFAALSPYQYDKFPSLKKKSDIYLFITIIVTMKESVTIGHKFYKRKYSDKNFIFTQTIWIHYSLATWEVNSLNYKAKLYLKVKCKF